MAARQNSFAAAEEPSKLKIYIGPTSIPADNSTYDCIFVQLQDSRSRPARALNDTTISLSSSLTTVGDTDHTVTISQGSTYAVAKFHSTFTPGTTTIAATASGYATVQIGLTTVGSIPTSLAAYVFPPTIPADGNAYPAIIVQLQDSSGNPARAPLEGLNVSLTCSNTNVGTVPNSVVIQGGNTYAVANFQTRPGAAYAGTAEIIAIKEDYISKTATITTEELASDPTTLKVYVSPTKIMADNIRYDRLIAVQLLNDEGVLSRVFSDVTVNIASSEPLVGTVPPTMTISANRNLGFTNLTSTYRSGTTTITAGATDYRSSTATLSTIGPIPSKIVVYCVPSSLPADNRPYDAVRVQLQDSGGKPAKDPDGEVMVSLFSSEPAAGTVSTTLTIPYGRTYATATFTSTYQESQTTITTQASGYSLSTAQMNIYMIDQAPLGVSVTASPNPINSGNQTNIIAQVTYPGGSPVTGATVKFSSSGGGTFSTVRELENGLYNTTFKAPSVSSQTDINVTATASKIEYATSIGAIKITVLQPPPLEVSVTPTPSTIDSGDQSNVVAYVTYVGGSPVTGATVKFSSSSGGTFSTVREQGNGFYNTTFTAPSFSVQTDVNITATASKTDYSTSIGMTQITVLQLPALYVSVTAIPSTIDSGDQTNVAAIVTDQGGVPVTSATVKFTSSSGGTFSTVRESGNGLYNTTFKAPILYNQTDVDVTATVSKIDYATSIAITKITVLPLVPASPGTLTLCIKDDAGQPVSEAIVSTLTQPAGMKKLMDITNSSGYVVFPNAKEGTYTINVNKQGYTAKNTTLAFKADDPVRTLFITGSGSNQSGPSLTIILLVVVAVVVVVIVVVAAYIQRRKTAKRFQVPKKWEPPAPPKPRSETSLRWRQTAES